MARLKGRRKLPTTTADPAPWTLKGYAERHLRIKKGERRPQTVKRDQRALNLMLETWGHDIALADIDRRLLNNYKTQRLEAVGGHTVRKELSALSTLLDRAVDEGTLGRNPMQGMKRPPFTSPEAVWYEFGEAARLLAAAEAVGQYEHALVATFLLTGGRNEEVRTLAAADVDFRYKVVRFKPNQWRGVSTKKRKRDVPLWPQLARVLRPYVETVDPAGLLFPSRQTGDVLELDLRWLFDPLAKPAKLGDKHPTARVCRHTYTAARLQTLDHGAPISAYTVMVELGHSSLQMILDTYAHLMNVRHRSAVVEYREADITPLAAGKGA